MQRTVISTAIALGLGTLGNAQSYVTSPKGYDHIEGESNASIGGYPNARYQYVDGDFRGNAMTLKALAFRADDYVYDVNFGMGRSWSKVTLDLSECDINNLSYTFSANPTTTPTRVMSAPVTWPTQNGKPPFFPADFNLTFPFQNNWVYAGTKDICADFVFTGGVLANNATWTSTTWSYYYVDGVDLSAYTYTTSTELGAGGSLKGCDDRGSPYTYGAQLATSLYFYSKGYSSPSYAGNLVFSQTGNYFGPNALVITAVGIKSIPTGWDFPGVYCNKVYLDPTYMLAQVYQSASSSGTLQLSFGGTYGIPAPPGIGGVELVTQAIWKDTKNFRPLLSTAATLRVPPEPGFFHRSVIYSWDPNAPTGSGPQPSNANPVMRYTR